MTDDKGAAGARGLEDVRFGDVTIGIGHRFAQHVEMTEEAIRTFATMSGDHNPAHHDAVFAAGTRYGGIIASGPHTLALFTAMVATHFTAITQSVGLEFAYRFRRAVKAGDRLDMCWEVTALEAKSSLGGVLADLEGEVVNQDGDFMLTGTGRILLTEAL